MTLGFMICLSLTVYAHNQVVVIPLIGTSQTPTKNIVGSWGKGYYPSGIESNTEPEFVSLTLYSNGYYIHYETGQASESCDNGGGVEYGTYTYNASTKQLTSIPIADNNGCVGLADNGTGGTYTVTVNDDLMKFDDQGIWFERVKDPNIQIVGSWGDGYYADGIDRVSDAEFIKLTFYPNGYYIHYETGQTSEPCDNGGGVEYGTYVFNAATNQITITPTVDNNGCAGLADNGVGGTYSFTITNDSLLFTGDTFWLDRVQ